MKDFVSCFPVDDDDDDDDDNDDTTKIKAKIAREIVSWRISVLQRVTKTKFSLPEFCVPVGQTACRLVVASELNVHLCVCFIIILGCLSLSIYSYFPVRFYVKFQ